MCCDTGGIFFHLKCYEIPLLIFNYENTPADFFRISFSFLYYHFDISAVTVQECVEKVLSVSQWKGTTVLIISATHQARWCFPQNDQKYSTLLAFKKDLPITLYQFFGKNMQFRRSNLKKQCHMCRIFCHVCHSLLL